MAAGTQYEAQKKIAVIWFIFAPIIIVLFALMAIPRSGKSSGEPFNWIVNFLSPALTLITSAFVYAINNREKLQATVIDSFYIKLVKGASVFYLLAMLVALGTTPYSEARDVSFPDHLKLFSPYLTLIQTSLLALLGIFFVKQQSKGE